MTVRLRVQIAPEDEKHAAGAAHWCEQFNPGVSAVSEQGSILLESDVGSLHHLEAIWASALFNERMALEQRNFRLRVLERLGP